MPELPEVEALARRLDERTRGRSVERLELASVSALKTYEPPISALKGEAFGGVERRGKYVCMRIGRNWLVVHLARGGWVRWREKLTASPGRPGRGPLALRVGLGTDGFDITEMGTEKRLALWVVADPADVEGIATLGPEPLDPSLTIERLGGLLAAEKGDLKHAISRQSVIAGVGNAYSDEVLHAARLSPFKPAAKLTPGELEALHSALTGVIGDAVERAAALDLDELKDGKRQHMSVHGRAGESCPVCGDTVREVSFATRSLQYCPSCQTGGRPLADRRLSRLLK
jgi:formamidopyrimidine-DNA glycosylase